MCGISGIVNFKHKKNAHTFTERVKAMNETMAHRGPDDSGHVTLDNGKILFGHRRLSILDVSKSGKQPMMDSSSRFVITFNGEIYNYIELRNYLKKQGYIFKTSSDTEVLINAWHFWKKDCIEKFIGMFSFAVIDGSSNYTFLIEKDVNFMREAYPNPATTGTPKHYSQWSDSFFVLGPTPDAAYNVELYYGHYPASIVTATNTFLGDDFDSALLNGALIEAVRFQKQEPDVIQNYEKLYLQSMKLLKNAYEGRNVTDNYRSGMYKVEVS